MARSHVRLQFGAWRKPGHSDTSKDGRWLYTTILCDETLNQAGVVRVAVDLWADDAGMKPDEARAALDELVERRFVIIDGHELLVRTFIRNDGVADQPNVLRNALEVARRTRSAVLRRALAVELRRLPAAAAPKLNEKTKRVFHYPDPHACADELDPDGAPPPGLSSPVSNPSRTRAGNPSGNPSDPVDNSVDSPVDNRTNGTLPGTLGGTPRGRGRGRGRGFSSVGGQVGGSRTPAHAPTREAPPTPPEPPPHPPRCPTHTPLPPDADIPPCHACKRHRETWDTDRAQHAAHRATHLAAIRAARDDCPLCDTNGIAETATGLHRCTHPTLPTQAVS